MAIIVMVLNFAIILKIKGESADSTTYGNKNHISPLYVVSNPVTFVSKATTEPGYFVGTMKSQAFVGSEPINLISHLWWMATQKFTRR